MGPTVRVLVWSVAGILGLVLLGLFWVLSAIDDATTPHPHRLGDLMLVERIFQADYAEWHDPARGGRAYFNRYESVPGGCLRTGAETVWREVNGVKSGSSEHRFPRDDKPGCADFVRQDEYQQYGRFREPQECSPFLMGIVLVDPSRSRYMGSDVYVARVPGGPLPGRYFDRETGRLTGLALGRVSRPFSRGTFDAELRDPADTHFEITEFASCDGYEILEVSIRPR